MPVVEQSSTLLATALSRGGERAHVFAESSLRVRYRIRQRVTRTGLRSPSLQRNDYFLEGASVCVDTEDAKHLVAVASVDVRDLMGAAEAASAAGAGSATRSTTTVSPRTGLSPVDGDRNSMSDVWAGELLRQTVEHTLSLSPRIRRIDAVLDQSQRQWMVVSAGNAESDHGQAVGGRPWVDIIVRCTLDDDSILRAVRGGPYPGDDFDRMPETIAREVAGRADRTGRDVTLKVGRMPVLLAAGWCAGVWVHEVVGHQLEADNFGRDWSVFGDRLGSKVADESLYVKDSPSEPELAASFVADDEGAPASETVLISAGVVSGVLSDRQSAAKLNAGSTGNGRRQDFRFRPQPRMTNLIVMPGRHDLQELNFASRRTLRVDAISEAKMDASTGDFRIAVDRATILESGESGEALSDIIVEGAALDALGAIALVGNDLEHDGGRGRCMKNGQVVAVGMRAPSILVEELSVRPSERKARRDYS